jgi:Protein of unknown function DUF2617
MNLASYRPRVAEMRFQLLERSVHPELFVIHKSHSIQRENYSARFCITADGHFITWQSGEFLLTEIAASASQLVPNSQKLAVPLRSQSLTNLDCAGCNYSFEFEMERVPAEMFWMIQKQLGDAAKNHELIHVFNSSGRLPIGGLSYIHVESRNRALLVQAIHTYPDDYTLVKTQSTFRCIGN